MPRGGKRTGAGRKAGRTFSKLDRWRFGAHCERLWRAAGKENEERAVTKKHPIVRRIWAKAQAVPATDRKSWLESVEGGEYLEDVESALCEEQGIPFDPDDPDTRPDRVMSIRPTRPKGLRKFIIWQVAKEETERLGRDVSERMVLECWKEFRRIEKDTDPGD